MDVLAALRGLQGLCSSCPRMTAPELAEHCIVGTRLPEKGPTTGSIIGAIIGVIILLAIIGTAVAFYRKRREHMRNGDGPPKHKPPPPKKTNSSTDRLNTSRDPVSEDRPLQSLYYTSQDAEPVTDLDACYDEPDVEGKDSDHYHAGAPSGWDDPGHNEVPPPYAHLANEYQEESSGVNRGDSFISSAMFV